MATEIPLGDRRADCTLRCRKRAEVQARRLAPAEVAGREAHADLWILDCRAAHASDRLLVWNDPELGRLFRWDRPWHGFAMAKRPVFLNMKLDISTGHGSFLEVTRWAFDGSRALGTGRVHTAAAMRSWMRYDIPLTTEWAMTS